MTKRQRKPETSTTVLAPRVACYLRTSTEDQAHQETIDAQRHFLRQYTALYQLDVIGEYADDGISGVLPFRQRPEGARLLQDAEAGKFGCVLAYNTKRLGRKLHVLLDLHATLSQWGVAIKSASEPFDTSSPSGVLVMQLLGSFAEYDRAQTLEQLSLGRDRVARKGKWTGGLIPYGYTVDEHGCLTPSDRLVEVLGMTEANVVRDLFHRMAEGSSSVIEANRLNALGVPTVRYYSNGTKRAGGQKWHPGPIAGMIANPTYRGAHVLQSRYGAIEREVPALVDAVLWEQANAQIKRNQHLPKGNATRVYLLRGLITCGQCGSAYVGQVKPYRSGNQMIYYRCSGRSLTQIPGRQVRCHARVMNAKWLEEYVWQECRTFIQNPGDALAEAQQQLHARMAQIAKLDTQREQYLHALGEKQEGRARMIDWYRRGRISLEEADQQLATISQEEAEIRQHLAAMESQKQLTEAYESHITSASLLLHQLQDRLAEVERTNDVGTKQQVIAQLVRGIRVDTQYEGKRKTATAAITYAFSPTRVADFSMQGNGWKPIRSNCWT